MLKSALSCWKEAMLVTCTSVLVIVLTTVKLFVQFFHRPANHVFIGMTHYFEDFYYYLDQFYQGANGGWLTNNNFTSEYLPPTLIYWSHILMGKVGGLLGLESYTSYNLSLLLLKFCFLIICYWVLKRIFPRNFWYRYSVFLIFLFSTTIPVFYSTGEGGVISLPLHLWGTKNLINSRFGNIPYRYVTNILFLILLLLNWSFFAYIKTLFSDTKGKIIIDKKSIAGIFKYLLPMGLLLFFLTLTDSAVAMIWAGSVGIMLFLVWPAMVSRQYLTICLMITVTMAISFWGAGLYLIRVIDADPVYSLAIKWDVEQYFEQFQLVKLVEMPFFFGTLGLLTLTGVFMFIGKKKNMYEQTAGVILALSICGYFAPKIFAFQFPGSRFLFSSTYLFAAVIGLYGFLTIGKLFRFQVLPILVVLYLLINVNTFRLSLLEDMKIPEEPDFHFTYIPNDLYDGFMFLRKQEPKNAVVLGNPDTSTDLMIPGLTGKKTYSGHFLTTLNSGEKDNLAHKFFYNRVKEDEALQFLKDNKIEYIMLTSYSKNAMDLKKEYGFLKERYKNRMITIFSY